MAPTTTTFVFLDFASDDDDDEGPTSSPIARSAASVAVALANDAEGSLMDARSIAVPAAAAAEAAPKNAALLLPMPPPLPMPPARAPPAPPPPSPDTPSARADSSHDDELALWKREPPPSAEEEAKDPPAEPSGVLEELPPEPPPPPPLLLAVLPGSPPPPPPPFPMSSRMSLRASRRPRQAYSKSLERSALSEAEEAEEVLPSSPPSSPSPSPRRRRLEIAKSWSASARAVSSPACLPRARAVSSVNEGQGAESVAAAAAALAEVLPLQEDDTPALALPPLFACSRASTAVDRSSAACAGRIGSGDALSLNARLKPVSMLCSSRKSGGAAPSEGAGAGAGGEDEEEEEEPPNLGSHARTSSAYAPEIVSLSPLLSAGASSEAHRAALRAVNLDCQSPLVMVVVEEEGDEGDEEEVLDPLAAAAPPPAVELFRLASSAAAAEATRETFPALADLPGTALAVKVQSGLSASRTSLAAAAAAAEEGG